MQRKLWISPALMTRMSPAPASNSSPFTVQRPRPSLTNWTSSYGWRWGPDPACLTHETVLSRLSCGPNDCRRKDVDRLGVLRHPIEKGHHARLQDVPRPNDQQPVIRKETPQ